MPINKTKVKIGVIAILFLLNIFAWQVVWNLSDNQYLTVDYFDVGQGDAILITTPSHHQILIDGGPDSTILSKLNSYNKTIDLMILSHPEKDHLVGLLEVLKQYQVENILWTGVVRDTSEWQEWKRLIEDEGADIRIAKAGLRIIIEDVSIDILNPSESLDGQLADNNNSSIILSLTQGEKTFLFAGDAGSKVEDRLNVRADVLKVSHHGSKYSTSDKFLEAVQSELAVISVGENSYGHPADEVLARLNNFGINVLRTDFNGNIKIFSDGKNLLINKL